MDFEQLTKIENESERVNRTYDIFNEDARLNHSKAARVEFLTTVHYIEKYLKDGNKILDIGAGAGEYMVIEESDRLIGECNYRNVADSIAEIGIKICETDCQNRGVGRKVLSMLIGWLFRNGYSKIVLDTNLTNTRAQHVYICSSRYFRLTRPFIVMYPFAAISSFNFLMILYASDWDTPNIFTTSSALINKHSAMF